MKNQNRLLCLQREKIGKNHFLLHFDRLMNHKEVERFLNWFTIKLLTIIN